MDTQQLALEDVPPPRLVAGVEVVDDQPMLSPLSQPGHPPITFTGKRVLTLADGRHVIACADCVFTGTRGEVTQHRWTDHGEKRAGRRAAEEPDGDEKRGPGRPKRAEGVHVPSGVLGMMLGELLEVAVAVDQWETVNEKVTQERDGWKTRALAAEAENRSFKRAFAKLGLVPKTTDDDTDTKPAEG